ncbi:unnamed protein product, partial [Pocillopora meandrina]
PPSALPDADKINVCSQDTRQYSSTQPHEPRRRRFRSRIMSLAMPTLLLMFVLDLAAIFFNGLLLLSCFRHEKKYRFFKKCWILLGLQVACQVVILVADAVEWWNGFRTQATESSCSVLIFSDVALARFESALWGRDLKRDTLFDGTVYLLILKFCLGTCLPLT